MIKYFTSLVLLTLLSSSTVMAQTYDYLGAFNKSGRPDYLVAPSDVISADFSKRITASLPEYYPVPTYHPEYLKADITNDVQLNETAEVWVTFVDEGAGYKNALAFYTYDITSPLSSAPAKLTIIFPNMSLEDDAVKKGDKVFLGKFPKNTGIGFALIANGFSKGKVGTGLGVLYSNPNFNPETDVTKRKHNAVLNDDSGKLIVGFEDINRESSSCDQDFNDAIIYVTTNPPTAVFGTFPSTVGSGGGVSTGGSSGLESDGCLAMAIGQRNFNRAKTPSRRDSNGAVFYDNTDNLALYQEPKKGLMTRNDVELEQFIPQSPFNIQTVTAYMTSPKDLIGITNAQKVLSVDYFDNATRGRLAAVLTTKTESKVYNHTKVICDRLTGSTLLYAEPITINGMSFIRSVLQREDGTLEYTICFSVSKENANTASVISRWAVEEYPNNDQYWNYQVWAEAPHLTQKVVEEILLKLKTQFPNLKGTDVPNVPKVFVKKGAYDNGILTLSVKNPLHAKTLTIKGNYTQTETKERADFTKQVQLKGTSEEETIEVFVGSVFDMGFTVRNDKNTDFDALYLADGAWGYEYDKTTDKVDKFDINPNFPTLERGTFTVERNPILRGQVKNYVSLFRSLRPAGEATDLTKYTNVSLTGMGTGVAEVTLLKKSITDWNKQYRMELRLFDNKQDYTLALVDFKNGTTNNFNANDITHIVFTLKSDGKTVKTVELALENVSFNNKKALIIPTSEGLTAFPNPAIEHTDIAFNLPERSMAVMTIANLQGHIIVEKTEEFAKGNNRVPVDLTGIPSGMYIVSMTTTKSKMTTKILIP